MAIERISAVTLAVRDMACSVAFYQDLGFRLVYGGVDASFTSLQAGAAFVNLTAVPTYGHAWWGRAIFRVDDADAQYQEFLAAGLSPESPRDAAWGERFFHVLDPDGHELSFAEVLPSGT
ncbi:MAG: VOC family protein [Planctomycetes bacterium]|nr:VOC family protein [Planctomycetota bacterium]